MKRISTIVFSLAAFAFMASLLPQAALADRPKDRVVAMYFHRTKRCPTCQKMGSYSEEAVKNGFAKEVKDGTVEFHYIDFQNANNAAMKKAYKVSGPALIVAKVADGKVAEFKTLKDIWAKADDKDKFVEYVQENISDYRK